MRRNFDIIRELLLRIADERDLQIDGISQLEVLIHLEMLIEAGFVVGEVIRDNSEVDPVFGHANRLTWNGHDFLEAIENPGNWSKIKSLIREKVGTTASQVWLSVATQIAKQALGL